MSNRIDYVQKGIDDGIASDIRLIEQTDKSKWSKKQADFSIVRFLRQSMGLTQKQFADLCGISPMYCYELETGKSCNPSAEIIDRMSEVCEIKSSTIRFFLNKQNGKGQLYQKCLITLLERLESILSDPSL